MRDPRRLGQAGGARSVDEQGGVAVGQAVSHGSQRSHRRSAAHGVVEVAALAGLVLAFQADDPQHHGPGQERTGLLDLAPGVCVGDHLGHADNVEAVGQGMAGQIGVDQGRGDADLGEAQPGGQIVGAIAHHQADDVGAPQVAAARPVGVAVGQRVQLAVAQRPVLVLDRDIVAEFVDRLLEVVTHQVGTVEFDRLDAL